MPQPLHHQRFFVGHDDHIAIIPPRVGIHDDMVASAQIISRHGVPSHLGHEYLGSADLIDGKV